MQRLDIRGRIKVLHGQNLRTDDSYSTAPLALFAVCTPFGPPSLLEMPSKVSASSLTKVSRIVLNRNSFTDHWFASEQETLFKSKHRLDLSWLQLDSRGRLLLNYSEPELANKGGYELVHYDDLAYMANAHQERTSSFDLFDLAESMQIALV
jgi:aryl hydrocarbon receptor